MRILVVEDENSVATYLKCALEAEAYAVDVASTGNEALDMAAVTDFDLLILDLILPEVHGLDVLKRLRAQGKNFPILILTGLTSVEDREAGLNMGADDYMTKPFSIRELSARVRALLRRRDRGRDLVLKVADLEVDRLAHVVRRGGKKIELSPKEFALLEYLMRNTGRPLTRPMIAEHVWNWSSNIGTNVVDVYINYLRNKVDRGFDQKLIHTVRGLGYELSEDE